MKTTLMIAALALLPIVSSPALAADEQNLAPGLSAAGAPLALHGADPVALLDGDRTVTGSAQISANHAGATYYFASDANKEAFEADPGRYVAQNGGFCTFGVSVGKKFDGNPSHFAVHDGKIYVFLNAATRQMFLDDIPGVLAKATANWEKIETIAASDL